MWNSGEANRPAGLQLVNVICPQVVDRDQVLSKSTALQAAAEQARSKVEESLELYKANCTTLQVPGRPHSLHCR